MLRQYALQAAFSDVTLHMEYRHLREPEAEVAAAPETAEAEEAGCSVAAGRPSRGTALAWLLGIVGTYTIGAFVHVLLVIAIVLFLVSIISGRRTVV